MIGRVALILGLGYVAAVLQQAVAPRWVILGVSPDFFLAFLTPIAMFSTARPSVITGFYFGLLQGALPTANIAHYVLSRSVAAFCVSASNGLRLNPSVWIAAATTAVATLLAQLLWMFMAAPPNIGAFLGDTIGSAMYNGVIAMPMYALLRKVLGPAPS